MITETPLQRDRAVTIFERSKARAGARSSRPSSTCPHPRRACSRAPAPRRAAALPEVAEPEIVRHYNRLSTRNFDLDTGFYPLGSCTMKHNPKLHERVAALPGNARLHPLQNPKRAQGALELMWRAAAGARRDRRPAARHPAAGGRLARRARGRAADRAPTTRTTARHRTKVLTPDTAHGTNPATVTMAGYEVVKVGTDDRRRRRHRRPAREGRRATSPA